MLVSCGICYSVLHAVQCPASYLTCGHVFCTSCCRTLVGRGRCPFKCGRLDLIRSRDVRSLVLPTGASTSSGDIAASLCVFSASATRHELLEAQCDSLLRSIKIAQSVSNHLSAIANDLDVRNMVLSKEKSDMRDAIGALKLSLESEKVAERDLAEALEDINGVIICTKRLASSLLDRASAFFPDGQCP